ncbi:HAD family hydrolase [Oerskovia flava]|uniref:HAD family hydrolase n=1 Tax=Oerskovia flava TaxID=2986422 RepID=UPI00223EA3F5|nr:HAD family hydrolase [Oerskovia sp. JB1-3-2]
MTTLAPAALPDPLSATLPAPTSPDALRARPAALLLDFGGVVFQTTKHPGGRAAFADHLAQVLARAGHDADPADLLVSIEAGLAALKDWKNSAGRRLEPVELDHRTIWTDFLASSLPRPQRQVLAGSAGDLLATMSTTLSAHVVRPGVRDLLATARDLGVPVGIVSNAHSGRAHRTLLDAHGLTGHFAVQVYSDEVGIRKPHPAIIEMAARALGTTPDRSWYVGDTQDRDVVAGRRAGVGAVIVTRHHHTDTPPYPVTDRPDAVYDTPEGLVEPLRRSVLVPEARPQDQPPTPATGTRAVRPTSGTGLPTALLLDHGGVIVTSEVDDAARLAFARELAALLGLDETQDAAVAAAVAAGRGRYRAWKAEHADGDVVPEIDPATFWVDLVGGELAAAGLAGPGTPDLLRAEAHALMLGHARAKSRASLRPGVRDVLELAREHGVPVAVVSNTVCGRAVREELETFGIAHLVGVHVYSDELGRRKPDPATVRAALDALAVDATGAWFVGDKPHRDVLAARRAGIGTTVVVRGGSTDDTVLDDLLDTLPTETAGRTAGLRPDHVISEMSDLLDLWKSSTTTPALLRKGQLS